MKITREQIKEAAEKRSRGLINDLERFEFEQGFTKGVYWFMEQIYMEETNTLRISVEEESTN